MASRISAFIDGYHEFMESVSDPRTKEWFLVGSPVPLITIIVSYLYFCNVAGPRYMKDRKPYELKNVLFIYNLSQVLISIYLVYEGLVSGWLTHYSLRCQPVDYTLAEIRMAQACWCYYMCKVYELLDTVFFILRKKNNQVSFLHLWHHTMMLICSYIGTKFLAGGHGTFLGVINSFVHIIMYFYYMVAGLGPEYQKYLWWKKHLTTLQMVQFLLVFIHCAQLFFIECNYPKIIVFLLGANSMYFLYLFGCFYYNAYIRRDQKKSHTS